jgi:hypothetical protein
MKNFKTHQSGNLSAPSLLALILALRIAATWCALNIFTKLTNVSDPFLYVRGEFQDDNFANRTNFIGNLGALIGRNFGELAPHYIFSVFVGFCLWILLLQVPQRYRILFLALSFFPSVTMWTALVTKESIAASALLLCLAAWVRTVLGKINLWTCALALTGLFFYAVLRPHFSLGLMYLFIGTWFFQPRQHKSNGPARPAFNLSSLSYGAILLLMTVTMAILYRPFLEGLNQVINLSLQYFRSEAGGSGRIHWLAWHTQDDFYRNLFWAVPFGVIGPLPGEAFNGVGFMLAFIEGVAIFIFPVISLLTFGLKFKRKPSPMLNYLYRLLFLVILPAIFYLYVIHAPLATPNPGSAIRYRAGFEYLLTIPILYISLLVRHIHLERDSR